MDCQDELDDQILENLTPQDLTAIMGSVEDGCIEGGADSGQEGQDDMSDLNNLLTGLQEI